MPRALRDRDKQADHIARDSPRAAIEQVDRIGSRVDVLSEYPEMGRAGRVGGMRELPIVGTPFVVIYRIRGADQRIEILRILHGAQQWPPMDQD